MERLLLALALTLAIAAPAAAQDAMPAPTTTVIVAPPTGTPPQQQQYVAPSYQRPVYAYAGRGREPRTVVGTRHEMQNDRGLWGLGLGLVLGGWALDIVLTAVGNAISHDRSDADEQDAQAWSILPFAGPIIQLGVGAPHPAIPITTGLLQISGLVCFVLGMTSQHDTEIPIYAFGDPSDARTARIGLSIEPTNGGAYASLTLHTM